MSAWNEAGTKPDHPCLCETSMESWGRTHRKVYQYWNGKFFGMDSYGINLAKNAKSIKSSYQHVQWREVQE